MIAVRAVTPFPGLAGTQCPVLAGAAAGAEPPCAQATAVVGVNANVNLNEIVAAGTRNSYKQGNPPVVMAPLLAAKAQTIEIEEVHRRLVQLEGRLRQHQVDAGRDDADGPYAADVQYPAVRMAGLDYAYAQGGLAKFIREFRRLPTTDPPLARRIATIGQGHRGSVSSGTVWWIQPRSLVAVKPVCDVGDHVSRLTIVQT